MRQPSRRDGLLNLNEQIGSDEEKIRNDSPLQNVAKVNIPVLLVHGVKDWRVQSDHSRDMAKALDRARKPNELVLIKGALTDGAQVVVHDPKAAHEAKRRFGDKVEYAENRYAALDGADALVVLTEWQEYRVLDLAEVLLETASSPEQRPQTTRVILAAVDELLDHAGLTQPYLGVAEEQRLRVIADRVQSWWPDGSMNAWRQGLESRLAAAGRRR